MGFVKATSHAAPRGTSELSSGGGGRSTRQSGQPAAAAGLRLQEDDTVPPQSAAWSWMMDPQPAGRPALKRQIKRPSYIHKTTRAKQPLSHVLLRRPPVRRPPPSPFINGGRPILLPAASRTAAPRLDYHGKPAAAGH
jgi:hypothetical protein